MSLPDALRPMSRGYHSGMERRFPAALRSVVRTISQRLKHMLGAFKWGLIKRISEAVRKPAFGRTTTSDQKR